MNPPIVEFNSDGAQVEGALVVNFPTLIRNRMLVQANSGGGKSRFLRAMLERTYEGAPQIILDYEGEFYTLREQFDYVLCGHDPGVPVHPRTARTLCRRLVEVGAHAVVDLSPLEPLEKREFVKLFLLELMGLPRDLWKEIVVVIDEAQFFATESGESQATNAVISLCTQGRKRGFCAVLATQRISMLNKNAAAELGNKFIGRTGLDLDQKRVALELGMSAKERIALRDLRAGTFHAFGPALPTGIHLVQSGPITTTHIEAGKKAPPVTPPSGTVLNWLRQIGDIPVQAQHDLETIAGLKDALAAAQRDLKKASKESTAPDPAALDNARKRGFDEGRDSVRELIRKRHNAFLTVAELFVNDTEFFATLGRDAARTEPRDIIGSLTGPDIFEQVTPLSPPRPDKYRAEQIDAPFLVEPSRGIEVDGTKVHDFADPNIVSQLMQRNRMRSRARRGTLVIADELRADAARFPVGGTALRIAGALREIHDIGITNPSKEMLGAWCGLVPTGGNWNTNIKRLRESGLIEEKDGGLRLTAHALDTIPRTTNQLESLKQLHARALSRVGSTAQRMLQALLDVYPAPIGKETLGNLVDVKPTGGNWNTNVKTLRTLRFIEDAGTGMFRAGAVLFPPGLN